MGVVDIRGGEHPAEPEECVIIGFSGLCSRLVPPGPLFAPPPGGERSNARGLCAPANDLNKRHISKYTIFK